MIFYCGIGMYIHIVSGIYGIKLANASNSVQFHKYAHKALIHYSALSALNIWAWSFFGVMFIVLSDYGFGFFLISVSLLIVAYLPIEGIKLIDTLIKQEICKAKSYPSAINMDNITFKNRVNIVNGVNSVDGDGTTGSTGVIITAMQQATGQK